MADRDKYKRAASGDIAYNMMRMWQGAVGVAPTDGLVSPAYIVARPLPGTVSRYFAYLYRTSAYMGEVNNYSHGIVADRNRLYWDEFKQIPTPYPPPVEQSAIVRFLDHSNRQIRRYIFAKRKLIKLLGEQKQAIIHHAVTRGLDPSVGLKSSGVEWLGDVPDHWKVAALRHRYSQCLGKMLDSKRITGTNSLPYLRNTDVQWDRINTEGLPNMDISPGEYARYTVQQGDLLVCEGGDVGRAAIWSGQLTLCGFQKALHRLRPLNRDQDVPRFMYYTLRAAAKANALSDGHLSTIAHLTGDKLRAHRFPFPTVKEQESLVSFLDSALNQVDKALSNALQEIFLVREYWNRLIADVVTGKLDVRPAAANLPDEADSEPMLADREVEDDSDVGLSDDDTNAEE
jgi:type I restriction enzyme S subunit